MSESLEIPSFEDVSLVLADHGVDMSPAEAHGLLCGIICVTRDTTSEQMFGPILGLDNPDKEKSIEVLVKLYEATSGQLENIEFNFEMLLPGDKHSLGSRSRALREWCRGFLSGFNVSPRSDSEEYTDDYNEAINYITEISNLDTSEVEETNEDEADFIEISEFVRMSVLMVCSEFLLSTYTEVSDVLH